MICSEKTAKEIKTDFLQTLTQCTEVTEETVRRRSPFARLFTSMLRLFEPLL